MKTTKSIIVILFVLLTAQIASAYYCPSTGRWLSRDPIGELGFENLRAASIGPRAGPVARSDSLPASRWIHRDLIAGPEKKMDVATAFLNSLGIKSQLSMGNIKINPDANQNTVNLYVFVGNDPIAVVDSFGLFPPCFNLPLPSTCSQCDAYGNETYPGLGVNLKCFCKCAGDSPWSKEVRGCLACAHAHGVGVEEAHIMCYIKASLKYSSPKATLAACYFGCGGKVPIIPPPFPF
jgi:hypothetical protein